MGTRKQGLFSIHLLPFALLLMSCVSISTTALLQRTDPRLVRSNDQQLQQVQDTDRIPIRLQQRVAVASVSNIFEPNGIPCRLDQGVRVQRSSRPERKV